MPGRELVELAGFAAAGALFLALLRESSRRRRWADLPSIGMLRAGLVMGLVWSWGAAAMYLAEQRANEFFASPSNAFWSMAVYLLSGFEDREPVTGLGRLLGVLFMLGGVSVVAYLTGEIASYLTLKKIRRTKEVRGMDMLIVNWEHRGDRLVREVNAYADRLGRTRPRIVVLTEESVDTSRYRDLEDYREVRFLAGDIFSKELLASIGAQDAGSVVVLAEGGSDPDARVALAVLSLRALALEHHGEAGRTRPLIIAESRNHRKRQHILDAGANEVITATDFHMGLLAQAAQSPATAAVYRDLLHASEDTCEVYVLDDLPAETFSRHFEGRSFAEAASAFLAADRPGILVGVVRGGRLLMAPGRDAFDRFRTGDQPVFIAPSRPRLD